MKRKRPRDVSQLAKLITGVATGEFEDVEPDKGKNPAAVKRGRKGGLKGGKARMALLSPAQRAELAKKAARKRWKKGRASHKRAAPP